MELRALNDAHSAFISATMSMQFFDHGSYHVTVNENQNGDARKFQVKSKVGCVRACVEDVSKLTHVFASKQACVAAFKAQNTVESCRMFLDLIEQRLVFELTCRYGIKKQYKLVLEESQVVYFFLCRLCMCACVCVCVDCSLNP